MKFANIINNYVQPPIQFPRAQSISLEFIDSDFDFSEQYFQELTDSSKKNFINLLKEIDTDSRSESVRILLEANCFVVIFKTWAYTFYFKCPKNELG